jgi:hypothetical protein
MRTGKRPAVDHRCRSQADEERERRPIFRPRETAVGSPCVKTRRPVPDSGETRNAAPTPVRSPGCPRPGESPGGIGLLRASRPTSGLRPEDAQKVPSTAPGVRHPNRLGLRISEENFGKQRLGLKQRLRPGMDHRSEPICRSSLPNTAQSRFSGRADTGKTSLTI